LRVVFCYQSFHTTLAITEFLRLNYQKLIRSLAITIG